jgi:hypothetical protein
VLGLGFLAASGVPDALGQLRTHAADPRWRVREAVAMALQHIGDIDPDRLFAIVEEWSDGNLLEQRAAAAAVCEPRLLKSAGRAERALRLLDKITRGVAGTVDRRTDEFRALRQALAYCWSVAVAAEPLRGITVLEPWLSSNDRDVRWLLRENLKKKRLISVAQEWVAMASRRLLESEVSP